MARRTYRVFDDTLSLTWWYPSEHISKDVGPAGYLTQPGELRDNTLGKCLLTPD